MVIIVNIVNNIKEFLYNQTYFVSVFDDQIYLFNFQKLINLDSNLIEIIFRNFKLKIEGHGFKIQRMLQTELLIKGQITKMEYVYD